LPLYQLEYKRVIQSELNSSYKVKNYASEETIRNYKMDNIMKNFQIKRPF